MCGEMYRPLIFVIKAKIHIRPMTRVFSILNFPWMFGFQIPVHRQTNQKQPNFFHSTYDHNLLMYMMQKRILRVPSCSRKLSIGNFAWISPYPKRYTSYSWTLCHHVRIKVVYNKTNRGLPKFLHNWGFSCSNWNKVVKYV